MKRFVFALFALVLAVYTVSAFAAKAAPKPEPKLYGWINASVNGSTHRATFTGSMNPGCATPQHQGISAAGHSHGWQTMHYCTNPLYSGTSGNWWNADKTIWQLKRSWCGCEGWSPLQCTAVPVVLKAYCYY